jgi:very-short-patch-repair endonuclease
MEDRIKTAFKECFRLWCEDQEEHHSDAINRRIALCESPIEQLLMVGLHFVPPYFCDRIGVGDDLECYIHGQEVMEPYEPFIFVQPQAAVGQYRVDFLITVKFSDQHEPRAVLVVECDGHDFHEKTKEQAAKDKRRDRVMTSKGLRVMRFTGSEIYKSPHDCALEVMECLFDAWERESGKK